MKRYVLIIVFSVFIFLCDQVSASTKPEVPKQENLLAECHYKYDSTSDVSFTDNLILYILKDYTILPISDGIDYNPYYGETTVEATVVYDNYMVDGKLSCNNLDTIYLNLVLSGANYEQNNYFVDYNKDEHETNTMLKENTYPREYFLDEQNSIVYLEKPTESSENEKWLKTCHYKQYYLSFNKSEHQTNIPDHDDVLNLLSNNAYSCPVSLCIESYITDGGTITYYNLSYTYKKDCIISTQYNEKYKCGMLSDFMKDYSSINESLKEEQNVTDISELNKIMNETKTFCNSIMKNMDYSDPTNCVQECMEVIKIMSEDQIQSGGECGFSQRLLYWIANIVRWIKYIIPVAVIVLGILDFIKAVGADKDDEMKKAQGRFVKRLIAAALIFIIPFIIEFVLDKMGFTEYISGCGIIDL